MKTLMGAHLWVNGTKVVSAIMYALSSASALAAAGPSIGEELAAAQPMHWPVLTGALAIVLLFFTWWQQARHRRNMEESNAELRRSEEEARRAFAALRDSEEKFRLLFENTMDAIMFLDPQTKKFVDCNEAAVKASKGGTREWFLSQPVTKISAEFQPDGIRSEEKLRQVISDAVAKGPQRLEWAARRFTGEDFTVDALVMPIRIANRALLVTVCRDITEQKRVEIALRQNEQLLTSILGNISEGVYRSSHDYKLIFANQAYLRMFGYSSFEELRSLPRERLYANPPDRAKLLKLIDDRGGYTNEEVEYRRKDGTTFWGLASSITVYEPGTQRVAYHVGAITDITERKKAEDEVRQLNQELERRIAERTAELRASEAQFRTLVEHAPEAIVVFDGETGRFLSGNENALRLYGVSHEGLTQLTPAEVSPPFQPNGLTSAAMAAQMMRRARDGQAPVFEWMHRSTSGRLIPTEVRLVRLPAEGKCLLRASILDTSGRRRREQIQQATYQISEAVHATDDLDSLYARIHEVIKSLMPAENFYIAVLDRATELISFPYFVDQLASAPPEPRRITTGLTGYVLRTGKPLLIDRSRTERKKQVDEGVLVEGMELPYIESGRPAAIWLGTPLTFRGKTFGVMALQDYQNERAYGEDEKQILAFVAEQIALIIERKRSEQALRESEEKHRALYEATSQGVMLHDEHQFLDANPAAVRILGYDSAEQIIGKHPSETSAPIQMNGQPGDVLARKHIADCMEKGSTRFEWLSRSPAGKEVPLEVILTRIQMGGRPIIQAVVNDISERKKAEAELLKSLAREKELSALKTNFVSMVSHEFRTPLGVIMSSSQILDDYFDRLESEERREHLRSIQKHTRRMADLMEEVLLLSRAEAGKLNFDPRPLDVRVFTRRLTDEVIFATNHRCLIDLSLEIAAGEANGDERLLRHILTNLLSNAVKYSPEGGRVSFSVRQQDTLALFAIRDEGIGIPKTDQGWLFNAFHRGTNVGNTPGSGLGLVIVKRCVELHGGTIHIESSVGQGTRVEVSVPMFELTLQKN